LIFSCTFRVFLIIYSKTLKQVTEEKNIEIVQAIRHYFSHLELDMLESFHLEEINNPGDIAKNSKKIDNYITYLNNWGRNFLQQPPLIACAIGKKTYSYQLRKLQNSKYIKLVKYLFFIP